MNKEGSRKNRTPQRVLVTGGGGFLGSAIVKRLVGRGDIVSSFSRSIYPELASAGVEQIQGDISDRIAVEAACKDMDLVFHVAAKPGIWGEYDAYFQTNVVGTQNVVAGCIAHTVSRLVYTSSPSVVFDGTDMEGVDESIPYPEHFHAHYPKTKAIAEQHIVQAASRHLMTITLRPHLIWGPQDNHLVPRIIKRGKRLIKIGNGKNLVDTIYIDNAADAHILAADALEKNPDLSGRIYFISQGDPVLLWEMVNDILNAAELPPVQRSMSRRMARGAGALLEFLYTALKIEGEPQMTRFLADELATAHWFDISAARKDLGYVPRVSTEEGLQRLEAWLKENT